MLIEPRVGYSVLTEVRLYPSTDYTAQPAHTLPLTAVEGGYDADDGMVPPGRWYRVVTGTKTNAAPGSFQMGYIDLPVDDRLTVSPETLAVDTGVPLPLTDRRREIITGAILAAQSDVVAHLGRPVLPATYTQHRCWAYGDGWNLTEHGDEDVRGITSVEPEMAGGQPTGYYTVTYVAGIDAREGEYEPIRRFVIAHAKNSPEFTTMWRTATGAKGEVKSVSAEGQSISYASATLNGGATSKPGDGSPGALPTLASLDRWRLAGRRVAQGRTRTGQWPYSGAPWPQ